MKSIRPLVTITILTVVGVFLFRQLNEGPALDDAAGNQWATNSAIPSLQETTGGATSPFPTVPEVNVGSPVPAPNWSTPAAETEAGPLESASNDPSADLPAVPQVPQLPPLNSAMPSAAGNTQVGPPANVPVARYPDSPPETSPTASNAQATTSGQVPSLGTVTSDAGAVAAAGMNTVSPTATTDTATMPTAVPSMASETTPLTAEPQQPAPSGYAVARATIVDALSRGDLAEAHLMLTEWRGDESLSPAEIQEVNTLLSQLAGTVIYSTEHRLEAPYMVKPGDTLDTIAQQYQVPWQLLAKINGIPRADAVQPGQQLKVVRGPVTGELDLSSGQLTLLLDGRYAGAFTVNVPQSELPAESEWVVENKVPAPTSNAYMNTATQSASSTSERSLVLRSTNPTTPIPAVTLGSSATPPAAGSTNQPVNLQVAAQDAEELCDILSVGSRVVIRK